LLVKMCRLLGVSADYMLGMDSQTIPSQDKGIFVEQLKELEGVYNKASRERQRTIDSML